MDCSFYTDATFAAAAIPRICFSEPQRTTRTT
jgi:hypothetical protein